MRETTPAIRLISRPSIDWEAMQEALHSFGADDYAARKDNERTHQSDAELLIEYGGRRCYRSWEPGLNANVTKVRENPTEYLGNIVKSGHGSVLEHAQFTFDFDNVSRVVMLLCAVVALLAIR